MSEDKPVVSSYFTVKDSSGRLIFEIDKDGNTNYLVNGELRQVTTDQDLALAFMGTIFALLADGHNFSGVSRDEVVNTAITAMGNILVKHENDTAA